VHVSVGKHELLNHVEPMPLVQQHVAADRGLQVAGHAGGIGLGEDRPKECRSDALALPLRLDAQR
jgi:hypothetical protein